MEWAKEGRRIIPLLKRATPITAFTPLADAGAEGVASLNKALPSPLNTKTESKRRIYDRNAIAKYTPKTPPTDLKDMVTRVKDEEMDEAYCVVRSPPVAIPAAPSNVKAYANYFGGEVVVLPSGKAVRLNKDKFNEINEAIDNLHKNKRKRKSSASEVDLNFSRSFEVLPKNALMSMMPPPMAPPSILGQHLLTSTPTRGMSTRGRRGGAGSRGGGRRPRGGGVQKMSQPQPTMNNLAMLAEAVSHQQEKEASEAMASMSSASPSASEPPQMAITPPKVVVVTTPSGTVLRTSTETSTASVASTMNLTMTTSSTTPVATKATPTASKLKAESSSPMKVFPVGAARILPKTATSGTATPIYMVATSVGGQNFMRVTRPVSASGTGQTVTLSSGQRVVTVNTSSLRAPPGTGKPGPGTVSAIKALQPRVVTSVGASAASGVSPKMGGAKNSVIVVQRSGVSAKALITKVLYRINYLFDLGIIYVHIDVLRISLSSKV